MIFLFLLQTPTTKKYACKWMIPDSQSVKIEFPLGNGWHQFLLFVLSELWPAKGKQLSGRSAVYLFITARKRSLGQGNIFTSVCDSFCPGGVSQYAIGRGCMQACNGGVCLWVQGVGVPRQTPPRDDH